jgi:hypothetical protein
MTANITFPALLQAFFTDRLLQQKGYQLKAGQK